MKVACFASMVSMASFGSVLTFVSISAAQPAEPPPAHSVGGLWIDNAREVQLAQDGANITATFLKPYDCDHQDGTGEHSQTMLDFNATLAGDMLVGETTTCRWGPGNNPGLSKAEMTLVVNSDDTEMRGTWSGSQGAGEITLTRASCAAQADINDQLEPRYAEIQVLIGSLHADSGQAASEVATAEAQGLVAPGSAEEVGGSIELAATMLEEVDGATRVQFFSDLGAALQQAQLQSVPPSVVAEQVSPAVVDFQAKLQQLQMLQVRALEDISTYQSLQQGCATPSEHMEG